MSVLRTIFLGGLLAFLWFYGFALRIFYDVFLRHTFANGGNRFCFVVTFILVMASNSLGFVWAGRDIVSSNSHWVRIISPDPADQVPVDCLFRLSAFDTHPPSLVLLV